MWKKLQQGEPAQSKCNTRQYGEIPIGHWYIYSQNVWIFGVYFRLYSMLHLFKCNILANLCVKNQSVSVYVYVNIYAANIYEIKS